MTASAEPIVHIVFNMSAAGSIRQAFGQIGCGERVIGFPDNLAFGPINPPSASLREEWVERRFGYDWVEVAERAERFWHEATAPNILPVVWVCRQNAAEYAGFLEFLWRKTDASFRVIDVTGLEFVQRQGQSETFVASSLGTVAPGQIIGARLIERQATLRPEEVLNYRETWRRLKQENAPLRIVDETGLVSAPITYFDGAIASCATNEWRKGAYVVGKTMSELIESPGGQCPSDLVLWARVRALGDAGVLETSGDGLEMRNTLVRRAKAKPSSG